MKPCGVAVRQGFERLRGGRRNRRKDAEKSMRMVLPVAFDQGGVVEIVPGIEQHALGKPGTERLTPSVDC